MIFNSNIRGQAFLLCKAHNEDTGHLVLDPECLFTSLNRAKYRAEQAARQMRGGIEYEWTSPDDKTWVLRSWYMEQYVAITPAHAQYTDTALVYWIEEKREEKSDKMWDEQRYAIRAVPLYACQMVDTEELT